MKNGRPIAHNARYEQFLEQRDSHILNGRHGKKWVNRFTQEIRRNTATANRAAAWKRSPYPHLVSRIERARRVKDPLYGISTHSELLDAISQYKLNLIEKSLHVWAFIGTHKGVVLTLITPPLEAAPVGAISISPESLPYQEIYLQHQQSLLVFCAQRQCLKRLSL